MIMPKKTLKGIQLEHKIKGFKLYMETAEQYRQQFYEKENMLNAFLPYAILFGMTKEWLKKMRQIYGDEYIVTHYPIWHVPNISTFSFDSFETSINSLSSKISQSISSSSGTSGSGGSGGGGGEGGGGGW